MNHPQADRNLPWLSQPMVLVDFWAPSCAPCLAMMPLLEKIAQQTPELMLCKVNADEQIDLAEHYRIQTLPTLLLFRQGEEVGRLTGVVGESQIKQFLAQSRDQQITALMEQLQQWRKQQPNNRLSSSAFPQHRKQLEQHLESLERYLDQFPDDEDVRALLIHVYLDARKSETSAEQKACWQRKIEQLQQVSNFDWLRGPGIQQACARAAVVLSGLFDQSPVNHWVQAEQYDQAATELLALLQHQPDSLELRQQFIQLLDLIPDRSMANQLRRQLHAH
ncbi:thioredoxin family protein [Bacterioplanoides sp.]|uniref:thioredoxin family protein n=1 Tax=Bacterioplanoides sp. TaxID=2066072 RepID=UPI003AFF98E9